MTDRAFPLPAREAGTSEPATPKGEQTRRAILDAAIDRFGRDGYRATSVADIARDAGVSGTAAYAYFPNKQALFLAALDEDAAGVIQEGLALLFAEHGAAMWRGTLIYTLVEALDRRPLARRVLAGLEPDATDRVLELPALEELRKALADRLRLDQLEGTVRPDIDPTAVGSGSVTIFLTLLMGVLQFGTAGADQFGEDVIAVFQAALDPVRRPE